VISSEEEEILVLKKENAKISLEVASLTVIVNKLLEEIAELKSRLNKNSSNCSKPQLCITEI